MFVFFIYGTLTALFALIAEIMSGALLPEAGFLAIRSAAASPLSVLAPTIIVLASIEELLKYFVLRKTLRTDSGIRPIPASLLFGIGFAATELGLLSMMGASASPSTFLPLFGILTVHVVTSVIYGYGIRRGPGKSGAIAVLIGILLHTAYNLVLALI
ncbi:MAG: hypothetical protein WCL23_05735 [Candidatus Moraniibacteriota bacterium]